MSVTLSEVKRAAKAHRAPLAGESAGYLVLAIADQVLSAPRLVDASDIQLTDDGALRVLSGRASSDAEAELGLRRALDGLLLVASSGSAALTRASRRVSPVGLSALVRELEAALIPVNRSAARRALARLCRETARAVSGGNLPAEPPEPRAAPPEVASAPAPERVAAPVSNHVSVPKPVAAPAPEAHVPFFVAVAADAPLQPALPALSPELDAMLTALCAEPADREPIEESDALTIALDVRSVASSEPELELEIDVELEGALEPESESGVAPTVVRAPVAPVAPVALAAESASDEPSTDMPIEACTRPEPVVLRRSRRPESDGTEYLPRTPTLGSLAAPLPVLAAERLAELSELDVEDVQDGEVFTSEAVLSVQSASEAIVSSDAGLVICSAPIDECTEPMPDVLPLLPGVAIVTSRKSDVSELLKSFQVADDDSNQGLCRAIKEMAGLDLTPAPFAALIR